MTQHLHLAVTVVRTSDHSWVAECLLGAATAYTRNDAIADLIDLLHGWTTDDGREPEIHLHIEDQL